jgi:hypothetical protein
MLKVLKLTFWTRMKQRKLAPPTQIGSKRSEVETRKTRR